MNLRPLLPAFTAGVCLSLSACQRAPPEAAPPPTVTVGPESVARVEVTDLRSGPLVSGRLEPIQSATLNAEVAGSVLEVSFEEGEPVKKGDVLVRLDPAAAPAELSSARAAVETARQDLEVARADERRSRELFEAGAVARQNYERSVAARQQAEARLEQARAGASGAREQVGRSRVVAPFDGFVSEKLVRAGDHVQPGAPLLTVVNPSGLRFEASVPVAEREGVKPGAPVTFEVSGLEGTFRGEVERVNPVVDPATNQLGVHVSVPAGQQLLGGQYAEGRIATRVQRAPALPLTAIARETTPPTVLRIRNDRTERVPVKLGVIDEVAERVQILEGVKPGDVVLTGNVRDLPPDTQVQLAGESPSRGVGGAGDAGTPAAED